MNILDKIRNDFDRLEIMFDDVKYYYLGSIHAIRFIDMTAKERNLFLSKLELRCMFMLGKIREIREEAMMLEDDIHSQ